jgi:hypothetical protein
MNPDLRPTALFRALRTLALALLATTPATLASEPVAVTLVSGTGQLLLTTADGDRVDLALAPGARFRRAEALDDGWIAAGVRDHGTLLLVRSHDATAQPERMTTPAPDGPLVSDPIPLVRDGRLEGLAWLAGDGPSTLGVRHAEWLGDAWGPTETVAGPGPGSQLALAGVTFGEDETLLVWSAHDGADDEIVWARRSTGTWTEPERIADDNPVPDITPAVTVLDGRPVAAWSRYDGRDYRLVVSRMEPGEGAWSAPVAYGPRGSLFPRFGPGVEGSDVAILTFREAASGRWTALKLDRTLRTVARASLDSPADVEPVVLHSDSEGLELVLDPTRPAVEIRWNGS